MVGEVCEGCEWGWEKRILARHKKTEKLSMDIYSSKTIMAKTKFLGIYQIAGGIIGLGLSIRLISQLQDISLLLLLILLIGVFLYFFSIYCGIQILQKKDIGLKYSLANQYLQLVTFTVFGFTFQYFSGVFVAIGYDFTESFLLTFNAGVSSWKISINTDEEMLLFSFNFVAFYLIIFINKLRKEINDKKVEQELDSLGGEK